ncbi:MAG: glycosyltransferase, partial [Calditrichaeota bacterium]|nr:glycosyltransferase [Calditrichota bacterium]
MNRPIKILYLIDQLTFGGAERHLVQVLQKLDRSRFEPHLWVLHGKWDLLPEVEKLGIPFRHLNVPNILTGQALRKIPYWAGQIREEGFRILHTYLFASNSYGQVLGALAGVPLRVSARREMVTWMRTRHILFSRFVNQWVHHWIVVSKAVAKNVNRVEHIPWNKL